MNTRHRLLVKLAQGQFLSKNKIPESMTEMIQEMLDRNILHYVKPEGSKVFKYGVSNPELFNKYTTRWFSGPLDGDSINPSSREEAAIVARNTKAVGSIKVDSSLLLKVFSNPESCTAMPLFIDSTSAHGIAAIDIDKSVFIASGNWVSVENYETFFLLNKQNNPGYDGAILLKGNPSHKRMEWMKKSIDNGATFTHFGDLDFSAMEHFGSICSILDDRCEFWFDPEIGEEFFRKHGNKELWKKQKGEVNLKKLEDLAIRFEQIKMLFNIIKMSGFVVEQERIHSFFFAD